MKAYVLYGAGDLRFEEAARPVPGPHEVLVRVKAAGICGSDIPRVFETGAHRHPLIPGHEFAGVAEAAGSAALRMWEGKRVGVFPLIPCRACPPCRAGRYELCESYGYLGSRQDGGFAAYAAVPAENLIALPDAVPFEAAAMLEPLAVAVHAMRRAGVRAADTVAVCGLGTVGRLLSAALCAAGARRLFLIGNKESQRAFAERTAGAAFCDGRAEDAAAWLRRETAGRGADVFFECVGRNEAVRLALAGAAAAGRVVLVGNPASDMRLEKAVYWRVLRKELTVTGTWNSSFTHDASDDWHEALRLLAGRKVRTEDVITHRLPSSELLRGLLMMRDKTEDFGKVMTLWD